MKHILPILTAALALTAMTSSAIDYYSDYILKADESGNVFYAPYNHNINIQTKVDNYENYSVIRTNLPDQGFGHDTTYRVQITGEKVDFYLTDYIDSIGSNYDDNALTTKGIKQIGYRYLESNDSSKKGTEVINNLKVDSSTTETYLFSQDKENNYQPAIFDESNPDRYNTDYKYNVVRNHYYLGTFSEGDVIEIYMSREEDGNGVWSTSTLYTGGYGEGVTDATDQLAQYQNGGNSEAGRKAMPLASLTPAGGSRVFFGFQASGAATAVGSPLPGGLQIALIAGLFGLGFYFVRRRKATVA
ncbi:MAG: hypothetical protein IKP09_06510 [Lentisphaeria bacterium]|nr:hypothetical protein [Lentisphaeria bacterium]